MHNQKKMKNNNIDPMFLKAVSKFKIEEIDNDEVKNFFILLKAYIEGYKFKADINIESLIIYEFLGIEQWFYNLDNKYKHCSYDLLDRLNLYFAINLWLIKRDKSIFNSMVIDTDKGNFDINKPMIIAGFPGVGKSTAAKLFGTTDIENENMDRPVIISKSSNTDNPYDSIVKNNYENHCIDLESSDFHWIIDKDGDKHLHPEWPANYINAIKLLLFETRGLKKYKNLKYVCISTHKDVLNTLRDQEIEFCIVAPLSKENAIERYKKRGSSEEFIQKLDENWDTFMNDLDSYDMPVIKTDEYLYDILRDNRLVKFIGNQKLDNDVQIALKELSESQH